jgi:hypothetical protein
MIEAPKAMMAAKAAMRSKSRVFMLIVSKIRRTHKEGVRNSINAVPDTFRRPAVKPGAARKTQPLFGLEQSR